MLLMRLLAGSMGGAACVLALAGACGGSEFTSDGAGGSGNDGGGPPGSGGCGAPADCPGQDLQCAKRSCEAGACGITNAPLGDPTAEQYAGDCKTVRCNGQGAAVIEPDETDTFDDGNQCTVDGCPGGVPTNEATPGADCSLMGSGDGVCNAAATCVECLDEGDCSGGDQICAEGKCVPASCDNDLLDGQESDMDCGGPECLPCGDLKICEQDSDCLSGVCDTLLCQVPTCHDEVHNGAETGVDCGGATSTCKPCPAGEPCAAPADCGSHVCIGGKCKPPTCLDGVTNGQETDQDCGGTQCNGCPLGEVCIKDGDCQSAYCGAGMVCADRCQNMVRDGGESDVDCGGPSCSACGLDARCLCNNDCESEVCCVDLTGGMEEGTCVADLQSCVGSPVNICPIN